MNIELSQAKPKRSAADFKGNLGPHKATRSDDKRKRLGPYSTLIDRRALGSIRGGSREGKFLRHYEQLLTDHVGGNPDAPTKLLITRASRLALHLELLDEKAIKTEGGLTPTDQHFYCVWSNSLSRHLAKLQAIGGHQPTQSLDDILAEIES
jgi:hypothetical protein